MNRPRRTSSRRRWLAIIAAATFCALIAAPGLYQLLFGMGREDVHRWRQMAVEHPPAEVPAAMEADLNQRFLPGLAARIFVNGVNLPALHGLVALVVPGNDGWLFYSSDVAVVRSIGFLHPPYNHGLEAAAALGQLSADLKARQIRLLVVPVPAKASTYPEHLDARYDVARGPDLNLDHQAFFDLLTSKGVETLDLTEELWAAKAKMPVFFPTDSHWSQAAKRLACEKIAERIIPDLPHMAKKVYASHEAVSHRVGDLKSLYATGTQPADITETQIVLDAAADDSPIRRGDGAAVLVLGDSFAAQFEPEGAGFSQMLMQAVGQDVQSMAHEGATPDQMIYVLNAAPNCLQNTRVVVLVFSIRHVGTEIWPARRLSTEAGGFGTADPAAR